MPPTKQWLVLEGATGDVHITPEGDIVAHDESDACVCMPQVVPTKRADGSMGWSFIHASLDGRELREAQPAEEG